MTAPRRRRYSGPMPRPVPESTRRVRAAFGSLLSVLVDEVPARAAWLELAPDELEGAFERARHRLDDPGHALGFRTVLKQELDALCGIEAIPMSFEASTVASDARWRTREARRDERARDRERQAQHRRDQLREQAARLLRGEHERRD